VDTDRFWRIIDSAKSRAGSDEEARIESLKQELEPLSTDELQSFQNHYDSRIRDS
jgi:hypothetical protein